MQGKNMVLVFLPINVLDIVTQATKNLSALSLAKTSFVCLSSCFTKQAFLGPLILLI